VSLQLGFDRAKSQPGGFDKLDSKPLVALMKIEIEDQVIDALKAFTMAFEVSSEDSWTTSLMVIRAFRKGIDPTDPAVQVASLILTRTVLNELPNAEVADAIIRRAPKADETQVRQELESFSDDEGVSLRNDVRDLAKNGPAMFNRGLKAASEVIDSPSGQLPTLTTNQSKEACKRILDLQRQGVGLGEAKKRAAQHHGVSVATINRVWRVRKAPLTE
jgi:hypothetical protein